MPGAPSERSRYLQDLCVRGHQSVAIIEASMQQLERVYFAMRRTLALKREPSASDRERVADLERQLFRAKALVLRARASAKRLSCHADRREASRCAATINLAQRSLSQALLGDDSDAKQVAQARPQTSETA